MGRDKGVCASRSTSALSRSPVAERRWLVRYAATRLAIWALRVATRLFGVGRGDDEHVGREVDYSRRVRRLLSRLTERLRRE